MKGGTRILAYEITVFWGSIPFIAFLTWRAKLWGLNERTTFLITVYLCADVMLLPWALRLGWISWWIWSIIVLFISLVLWPRVLIAKSKDNVLTSQINVYAENKSQEIPEQIEENVVIAFESQSAVNLEEKIFILPIEEPIDLEFTEIYSKNFEHVYAEFKSNEGISELVQLQLNIETSMEESISTETGAGVPLPVPLVEVGGARLDDQNEVNVVDSLIQVDVEKITCILSIDELIDLGFQEKHSQNFEQAASYFSQALAQDPIPDLAFSLIIDCYWLWNSMGDHDYALTQLQIYIQKHVPLFNAELRLQFDTWMVKEDLQIVLP
ncbi:hypothetical protein E4K67_16625 [Desulfosporosinus fructosivorans]|uniref:Tetratricopeptide repeat protein n=1 Tax=Desulfosporosinus fructosivorans TaxID=2018669 RepID=A0A4Z0R114_9FIRM|nr:hypothetical protein [Desulfosporosinus fructosivorans]TGE36742.1 hypothetical protein E4K67_16625 [Desulfosporosinus fructosivorans]